MLSLNDIVKRTFVQGKLGASTIVARQNGKWLPKRYGFFMFFSGYERCEGDRRSRAIYSLYLGWHLWFSMWVGPSTYQLCMWSMTYIPKSVFLSMQKRRRFILYYYPMDPNTVWDWEGTTSLQIIVNYTPVPLPFRRYNWIHRVPGWSGILLCYVEFTHWGGLGSLQPLCHCGGVH